MQTYKLLKVRAFKHITKYKYTSNFSKNLVHLKKCSLYISAVDFTLLIKKFVLLIDLIMMMKLVLTNTWPNIFHPTNIAGTWSLHCSSLRSNGKDQRS